MNRNFAKATIETSGGRRVPAVIACCSQCGHTSKISVNNYSGSLPPEAAANRFRAIGWFISNKGGRDICPKRMEAKKETRKKGAAIVALNPVVVEAPRNPTKEDNRLIFAKLNDVYLDERQGYAAGWTDEKVASDLGVPRAWVTRMREENFGQESASEDVLGFLNEAKAVIAAGESKLESARKILDEAAKLHEFVPVSFADLTKRLDAFEKKYR